MKKLLKYQMLNSYKYFIISLSIMVIGFILEYFLYFHTNKGIQVSTLTNIVAFSILILYAIGSVERLITKGNGIGLYLVPINKRRVFMSGILVISIYLILLIISIMLFNVPIGHIPLADNNYIKSQVSDIPSKMIIILNLFYLGLSFTYCLVIISTGIVIKILAKIFLGNGRFNKLIEIALFIGMFFIYIILAEKIIEFLSLGKTFIVGPSYLNYSEAVESSFMTVYMSSTLTIKYIDKSLYSVYIDIGPVIVNVLFAALALLISRIIFDKKVDI